MPGFLGDQVQQHQSQFPAPEHPASPFALHSFKSRLGKGARKFLPGFRIPAAATTATTFWTS